MIMKKITITEILTINLLYTEQGAFAFHVTTVLSASKNERVRGVCAWKVYTSQATYLDYITWWSREEAETFLKSIGIEKWINP